MTDINALWQSRLFSKYRNSPNILGLVEILSDPFQDQNDVLLWILSNDSIDNASGEMLDFFAGLIGVDRPPLQEFSVLELCRFEDASTDLDGTKSLAIPDLSNGGYLTGLDGIISKVDPNEMMPDGEFREIIRAKASSFRTIVTRESLYNYLLLFGVRCKIVEQDKHVYWEPHSYRKLNYWFRNYIETKGMQPAGIQVDMTVQTMPDSEI